MGRGRWRGRREATHRTLNQPVAPRSTRGHAFLLRYAGNAGASGPTFKGSRAPCQARGDGEVGEGSRH